MIKIMIEIFAVWLVWMAIKIEPERGRTKSNILGILQFVLLVIGLYIYKKY